MTILLATHIILTLAGVWYWRSVGVTTLILRMQASAARPLEEGAPDGASEAVSVAKDPLVTMAEAYRVAALNGYNRLF